MVLSCLLGIEGELFASVILGLILEAFPALEQEYVDNMSKLLADDLSIILLVVLVAPVFEELIFRLLVLSLADRFLPFLAANFIQAALFGIYHMNLVQGVYAFIFGFFVGMIKKYTASIVPCICFHISFNIAGLMLDRVMLQGLGTGIRFVIMAVSLGAFAYTFILLRKNAHDRQTA